MNKNSILAAAIVLVLTVPTVGATWYAYGDYEPNSVYDDSNFIWHDGPTGHAPRIYFNAFQTNFQFANPNVGKAETKFNSVPELFWDAMLGIWTDCNSDGYVGMAETAIEEYRDELLLDKSLCPVGSAHNQDGWVVELLWIGTNIGGLNKHRDPRIMIDPDAMVWGDQRLPFPDGLPGGSCALAALPKGTFQRTGAFLSYADCLVGIVAGTRLGTVYNLAAGQSGGTLQPLENPRKWDEQGHPMNRPTFGDEDASNTMVTAQDCTQPTYTSTLLKPVLDPVVTGTPAKEHADRVYGLGPRPLPPSGVQTNPNGNLPGTYNRTYEDANINGQPGSGSNCNTSDDRGRDFYGGLLLETENTGVDNLGKIEADVNFNFTAQRRSGVPGLKGSPDQLGLFALGYWDLRGIVDQKDHDVTRWISDGGYVTRPRVYRDDLSLAHATYWTFYAYVGAASTNVGELPGGSAIYGAPFCPDGFGTNAGIHNGWQCDADKWNRNTDGSVKTYYYTPAAPGQAYNLRDVDCFDGSIGGTGVGIEAATYGARPCSAG